MAVLCSLRARALRLPFRVSFAHASATRAAMQSLWVEARDGDGLLGHGEGCPREYVTGETLTEALEFVTRIEARLRETATDAITLASWVRENRALVDTHPAAWCAVELAVLDLYARRAGVSVETLLGLPALGGSFQYTAVIGDAPPARFEAELTRYLQAGFRDFKIKLSGDADRDAAKTAALRAAAIEPARVRADANNLWPDADAAGAVLAALDYPFGALEEPLRAGDLDGMARLAGGLRCAIILDESAVRAADLDRLPGGTRWVVNLRVSKMGGLLRSLELAARARAAGLSIIVGAHVGETSLLTRAALTVVSAFRDSVIAQEGAFGTHLLARDVVDPPLMFGPGGVLDAESVPKGPGFGLQVSID